MEDDVKRQKHVETRRALRECRPPLRMAAFPEGGYPVPGKYPDPAVTTVDNSIHDSDLLQNLMGSSLAHAIPLH